MDGERVCVFTCFVFIASFRFNGRRTSFISSGCFQGNNLCQYFTNILSNYEGSLKSLLRTVFKIQRNITVGLGKFLNEYVIM